MTGKSLIAGATGLALAGATLFLAQGQATTRHTMAPSAAALSAAMTEAQFTSAMRQLWEDHIVWTRQFIVSAVADLPDRDIAAERLLKNQEDIGNAVKPFYGDAAAARLTTLLKEHITIAADLVGAARKGDDAGVSAFNRAWYANGDTIAAFLSSANSNWKRAELQAMMREHLDLTLKEAVARLRKDWRADVAAYDQIHNHILGMADALSSGIVRQFPSRFALQ
jgi:hypothetical protein